MRELEVVRDDFQMYCRSGRLHRQGTHSEIQFAVEAVDFTRVLETSAVAKNLIFGLQYHLLFEPLSYLSRDHFGCLNPARRSSRQDTLIAGKRTLKFSSRVLAHKV
jgi:hypothetical protein